MKLIIAEKPSLAKNIISAIGSTTFTGNDGYFENNEYIVTWAYGHLFGLIDVEEYFDDYDPDKKYSWNLDDLPFIPKKFQFSLKKDKKTKKIDSGIKKQYNTIKKLASRSDVDTIINAGDADREGEIIIRIIVANTGVKKPVMRLWMPDQTAKTIKAELSAMRSDNEYNNLANEGLARMFIDWLYGINLTRYASLKSGTLLRVGRIIAPIVKAIYDRDMEIKNFVPEKYYGIVSKEETNGEIVELLSKTTFKLGEEAEADEFCRKYNAAKAIVTDVKTERKTINAGKLYSLSKLQGVLGRRYKMSLAESLSIVQKLYEAGYVTYPRTNTEYLATNEKEKMKDIISNLSSAGFDVTFKDNKNIFDDSKIESHSALTPTTKLPKEGVLSEKEQYVYDTIRNRFVAVFCSESCEVDRSTITIDVDNYETFTLKGDVMVNKGWTKYDYYDKKDKILPKLIKGDIVNTNFKTIDKETTPPKHYTVDSLNKYLKNPFKEELKKGIENDDIEEPDSETDDEEYKAILSGAELGTEATRTGIIDNAIKSKYISLKNNTYYIEKAGIYYVETLEKLMVNMDKHKTVELGKVLKKVYKGEIKMMDSINVAKDEIYEVFSHKDIELEQGTEFNRGYIGICPICGKQIKKQSWGYGCSGYKETGCKFGINNTIAGKKLTDSQVKALLENKITGTISGFTSKTGKQFSAKLQMDDEGKISFYFEDLQKDKKEVSCKCPKCGGKIINDKWAWKCENNCGFAVNYQIASKKLSDKDLHDLITNGTTAKLNGFKSKTGKTFSAKIVLDDDKKTKFEF